MTACRLTITTSVDGKETDVSYDGQMTLTPLCATISYKEENAKVCLKLENGVVFIERKGDYTLSLLLKKGETCNGNVGIGGSVGDIQAYTTRLAYSVTDYSFMLSLHYTLFIGGEPQKMKLRLFAKYTN